MMYRGGGQSGATMIPGGQLGKAKFALANGQYDEAERLLRKRLERQSDDASTRLLLAQALLQMRRNGEAVTEVRRVLRDQPKNVEALLTLSSALVQQGGIRIPKEAATAARRAVQLQPKAANTHIQLAEVLAAQRDLKAARIEVEEACKLEPRSASAQLMRALILASDRDPLGAIQASDSAIRFGKSLGPAALGQAEMVKANALSDVKRYDDALASLDSAERQNPTLAGQNAHSLRGRIYFRQRKIGPAYREFLAAQRSSGRLLRFAPALAGLNMVLSVFGNNAPVAFAVILGIIVLAILLGVSLIPAAGPWIVAVLVLAIVGFFAFAGVRYTQGSLLPAGLQDRLTTIGAAGAVLILIGALALFVEHAIVTGVSGPKADWFTPTTLAIAGIIAFVVSALALYGWPRLLARFQGGGAARA